MKTQIQLILSSIALTVLIWVYADQQVHDTYQTSVLVKFVLPPEPGDPFVLRVVGSRPEAADLLRAEITVRGPKSAIRRLEQDDAAGRLTFTVLLSDELKPGVQIRHDLFDDLSRVPELRNRGLSLQRVRPQAAQLDVDRYRNVTVDVEVGAGAFEKSLVAAPVVKPAKVTARLLQSTLERMGGTLPPLRVNIEEALQARAEQAGSTLAFDLPLHSTWPGVDASFTPDHVRVSVALTRRTVRERITLIPLRVLAEAQNFIGRYELEWQDESGGQFMQAIDVRVPAEKAGQLKGSMIDAYLRIRDTDLPKELPGVPATEPVSTESWIGREVQFVFPPGFEDVKMEGPPRTVKFRIQRKAEAPAVSPLSPQSR